MNMYIHDIYNHRLEGEDTLLYPKFKKGESIEKFDVVIANPPWNQYGYDGEVLEKGAFWREAFFNPLTLVSLFHIFSPGLTHISSGYFSIDDIDYFITRRGKESYRFLSYIMSYKWFK